MENFLPWFNFLLIFNGGGKISCPGPKGWKFSGVG